MLQSQLKVRTKTAQVFMSGRSQAVRLPVEFRFKTKEVFITRILETGELLLSPKEVTQDWQSFFKLADNLLAQKERSDFLSERDQESSQNRNLF